MIQIERYHNNFKTSWDAFNAQALNGTFFFNRTFMEYHADRFTDHSLLFFRENKLIALLPLHEKNGLVASHLGLSFGGLIISGKVDSLLLLQLFEELRIYLKQQHFHTFIYKPPPFIYPQSPAQDDLFALFLCQALLCHRALISVLDLTSPVNYSKLRQRCLKKAEKYNISLAFSSEIEAFMCLVDTIYASAGIKAPTHTAAEIEYLKRAFPDNIKLLTAHLGEQLVGGVLLFEHLQVVNLQYIATSPAGKQLHTLDLLVHQVINCYKNKKKYLSFGSSHDEKEPYGLNQNLLRNKASYGTRAVVQDTYQILL